MIFKSILFRKSNFHGLSLEQFQGKKITFLKKYFWEYIIFITLSFRGLPVRLDTTGSSDVLLKCVNYIKRWMANNFLQLNEDKTEVLILGCPANSSPALEAQLGPLSTNVHKSKVIFDSSLFFDKQISAVIRGSSFCPFKINCKVEASPFKQRFTSCDSCSCNITIRLLQLSLFLSPSVFIITSLASH